MVDVIIVRKILLLNLDVLILAGKTQQRAKNESIRKRIEDNRTYKGSTRNMNELMLSSADSRRTQSIVFKFLMSKFFSKNVRSDFL